MIKKRDGMPEFYALLGEMADTHEKKSHDYASEDNPSGNYHFAGMVALLFKDSRDAGFVGRIAEKIYRLANLQNKGVAPKNESIEDTEKDIAVIVALWMADRRRRNSKEQSEKQPGNTDLVIKYFLDFNYDGRIEILRNLLDETHKYKEMNGAGKVTLPKDVSKDA